MRIATAFINHESANAYYRMIAPMRELERRGHTILWPGHWADDSANYDVFYLQQFFTDVDHARIRRLRERGIAVVWETDDDISAIPKDSPAYAAHGGRRGFRGRRGIEESFRKTVEMARSASLMTTPSRHLADLYEQAGAQTQVIPNQLSRRDIIRRRRPHDGVVVGTVLAQEHVPDLDRVAIGKALQATLDAHAHVRVIAIGLDLKLSGTRYRHIPTVRYSQLVQQLSAFDIGLAPLADSAFSRGRSDVKLREYAAAGAMWLASPVGPYVGLGEDQGGRLVPDDGWRAALEEVVTDVTLRVRLARHAARWAEHTTVERGGRVWEAAFRDAIVRARRARNVAGR